MKEVTVISGKGGTGKTSLVAGFAALHERMVLADCDVDAADLHLVTDACVVRQESFKSIKKARIVSDRCTGCGECEKICRFGAVKSDRGVNGAGNFIIDPISCEGCGVCTLICPTDAIAFEEVVSGEWFVSETRHGPMVHAKLGIAESNSGKLVALVRSQARGIAFKRGMDMVLVDGPPGIGCPVIASVTGANLVMVVTEPTLSGLHDLERVRQLASHFKIKTLVCINKHDLNPEMTSRIEEHCHENGCELVGRIRYDPAITTAQLHRTSIVEYSDRPISQEVRQVWGRLLATLEVDMSTSRPQSAQDNEVVA